MPWELWLLVYRPETYANRVIGVLMTVFRTYARLKAVGFKDLRGDDFIVWLAIVRIKRSHWIPLSNFIVNLTPQLLYTTQSTLAYYAVNYGQSLANNAMTDAERAVLSPDSMEYQLRYVP